MAGFRHAPRDRYDDDLENWALWYVGCSIGASLARRDPAEPREGEHQPNFEVLQECTVVTWLEGKAQDTDTDLGKIQADIGPYIKDDPSTWSVRLTVARWWAGTGTDEYEAAYLGISAGTFEDRYQQVKRRLENLREARLSNKGRSIVY